MAARRPAPRPPDPAEDPRPASSTLAPARSRRIPPARSGPRRRTAEQQKGDDAEARAGRHLEAGGCVVVGVNVFIAHAELDLVVKDGDVVVFVEVKRRKTRGEALESVSPSKQQKLIRGASAWLALHAPTARARFDVVAVTRAEVFHVKDAFSA